MAKLFTTIDKVSILPYINNHLEVIVLNKYEIEIPDQVVRALGLMDKDVVNTIKKELAVHLFQGERLSFGQARQLSDLSVWDFLEALREKKIPLHYYEKEYEEDSKVIEELL
jgi:predicted HTH domain antitoxin